MSYTLNGSALGVAETTVLGSNGVDTLLVPSQAKLLSGLPGRQLLGYNDVDSLYFMFNANLADSAWVGVSGWENIYLYGGGFQTLVLGSNFQSGLGGSPVTVMANGNSGLNLDASALTSQVKAAGTLGADVIRGGSAGDQIWGLGGNDSLFGGAGDDTFEFYTIGQLASSYVDGGADFDDLKLYGSAPVTDAAFVNKQNIERLYLGTTGSHNITLGSQAGNAFTGSLVRVVASGVGGSLYLDGSALQTNHKLLGTGTTGDDMLIGGAGNDVFTGSGGSDEFSGNAGDDVFQFQIDAWLRTSKVDGGAGFDTVQMTGDNLGAGALAGSTNLEAVELTYKPVAPALDRVYASFSAADANAFTGKIIRLAATQAAELAVDGTLLGMGSQLYVTGTGGLFAYGGKGDDTFIAGTGATQFFGGEGNDTFVFGSTANLAGAIVDGGLGTDTLRFLSPVTGVTAGMLGANKTGIEVVQFDTADNVTITLGANDGIFSGAGAATLALPNASKLIFNGSANTSGFKVTGTAGADIITGGTGADIIVGGGGADRLLGNDGGDTFYFTDGGQLAAVTTVEGGAGVDYVTFTGGSVSDGAFAKVKEIEGIVFDGTGTAYGQIGEAAAAAINPTYGVVGVYAGSAITQLNINASSLTSKFLLLFGSTGNDQVFGSAKGDYFYGQGGADNIQGLGGDDSFYFDNFTAFATASYVDGGADYDVVAVTGTGTLNDSSFGGVRNIEQFLVGGGTINLGNSAAQAFGGAPIDVRSTGGAITVNGAGVTSANIFAYGAGQADSFTSGRQGDWFTGGGGADTFRFGANGGSDTLLDFAAGSDKLEFYGFGATSQVPAILANAFEFGGGTYLYYDNFQSGVFLAGVAKASLSASDFVWTA